MPLKAHAAKVNERYKSDATSRAEQRAVARLEKVRATTTFVRQALDFAVTRYFNDKDRAGEYPYPDRRNTARIPVLDAATFASGNEPDLEQMLKTLDERESREIVDRVKNDLTEAGFESSIEFEAEAGTLTVVVWDPKFEPVDADDFKRQRFAEELRKV